MEITAEAQHGGVRDAAHTILMPMLYPLDKLCRPYAWPKVYVTIEEYDVATGDRQVKFAGTIFKTLANPDGKPGLVKVTVTGWKALIGFSLNMLATSTCQWNLGDQTCCVPVAELRQTRTIAQVQNRIIAIDSPLDVPAGDDGYFEFGYATFDTLNIQILRRKTSTTFEMRYLPPPEWEGQDVEFTPGCDQTITVCRSRWNNERRFGGCGIAIPGVNALIESTR
jgi:hypothetical protein